MFFNAAKLVWFVFQPSNLLVIMLVLGSAALLLDFRRFGHGLLITATIGFVVCGLMPLGVLLLLPLEDRFPPTQIDGPLTGIVVLGGGLDRTTSAQRDVTTLNDAGERYTEAVSLLRLHPEARLIFSGGIGSLMPGGPTEAETARRFFNEMGVDPARVTFEDRSRDTHENALFSKALANPQPGERWVLITSAWHMPRSIGSFRAVGWFVKAWPTDYRTAGSGDLMRINHNVSDNLVLVDLAAKEWVGLLVYRLVGRTSALFPEP